MEIQQWENKFLSHFSYAIRCSLTNKIILIDPSRNPTPYLDYARMYHAEIIGIIETHPHADFVSSHLEISQITGATIYSSQLTGATYPYQSFDEGQQIKVGTITLSALNTPGHSPDSICIIAENEGLQKALFTGDTLFIGDCGRPDLREGTGNIQSSRSELARQMYYSLRNKIASLPGNVEVYPAHGAGTLCGKALSKAHKSTIAAEKMTNWCLQPATEIEFVNQLLADQPFIPVYFPFDVTLNRKGAPPLEKNLKLVKKGKEIVNEEGASRLKKNLWLIDARADSEYKKGYLPQSVNLMEGEKFETWLGSIISPGEKFYLGAASENQLRRLMERVATIGYEEQIEEAFVIHYGMHQMEDLNVETFKKHPEDYTIVDVRNAFETQQNKIFVNSLSIPLSEIRNRIHEIPLSKPVAVHCASGYRSAAGASLVKSLLNQQLKVYDLGQAVKYFIGT